MTEKKTGDRYAKWVKEKSRQGFKRITVLVPRDKEQEIRNYINQFNQK